MQTGKVYYRIHDSKRGCGTAEGVIEVDGECYHVYIPEPSPVREVVVPIHNVIAVEYFREVSVKQTDEVKQPLYCGCPDGTHPNEQNPVSADLCSKPLCELGWSK